MALSLKEIDILMIIIILTQRYGYIFIRRTERKQ